MKTMQGSKMVPPIFIGRWTPRVLFSLKERPYRHGQLRRHIGSVSQRMLTRTLRNLESTGLITKRVTRSKAIAVEYYLTQLGRALITPLGGMYVPREFRKSLRSRGGMQISSFDPKICEPPNWPLSVQERRGRDCNLAPRRELPGTPSGRRFCGQPPRRRCRGS